MLYIFWFLHQTTTRSWAWRGARALYIFWFLHQTTTERTYSPISWCCISFDSYIKPQHRWQSFEDFESCISFDSYIKPQPDGSDITAGVRCISFDSYIKPQLDGTRGYRGGSCISFDSYIKPQPYALDKLYRIVVYLLIPTSNHNTANCCSSPTVLYIFWFLHQTTTVLLL